MMIFKSRLILCQLRRYSSKPNVKLNEAFNAMLESKESKHRNHPGIIKRNVIRLPEPIIEAMKTALEDVQNKPELYEHSMKFRNHLHGRHVPMEDGDVKETFDNIQQKLMRKKVNKELSDEEIEALLRKNRPKAMESLKQRINMWKAINYDEYRSLLYMTSRSAQDYAILHGIFNEIHIRDQNFIPETVFDFGSGIGTTMWAINEIWPKKVKEFMNIDISNDMNNLSETIMKTVHPKFSGIFYRQFMPMSLRENYDISVSAFTLMELPNAKARLDAVMKLWRKTKNYLVIVEQGTKAGFDVVAEARDFILHLSNSGEEREKSNKTHAFAPCPHDHMCPKSLNSHIPCNFEAGYTSLSLLGSTATKYERFSYVVLKKGIRSEFDGEWPRLISPPLKKGRHGICRMCASSGDLEEIIFTPSKHGRNLYRCARVSKWGDRIPIDKIDRDVAIETECTSEDQEKSKDEIGQESDSGLKKEL